MPNEIKEVSFCPTGVKNRFIKNNISLTWHSHISQFCYYPPLMWPFISIYLSPLYIRIFCAKFSWNWPSGSWEEDLWLLSPLEKMHGPSFEQISIIFNHEYFVSCLVEMSPAVLEMIFKSCQYFFQFLLLSPFRKWVVLENKS